MCTVATALAFELMSDYSAGLKANMAKAERRSAPTEAKFRFLSYRQQ